jgi:Rad3-related DNA helicase
MNSGSFDLSELVARALGRLEDHAPGFEHRPAQAEMARLWSETLMRGGALAIEAPTGVGKSLAYLLPALALRAGGSGPTPRTCGTSMSA